MISESRILGHLEKLPHRSAGFKQLVRELSLRGSERRDLQARLEQMVTRGKLVLTGRDRYTLPESAAATQNLIAGRLSTHRDGYGFVIPDSPSVRERFNGDIYIPPPAIGAAMHGDQVLVEVREKKSDGRAEGRIARIVNRAHPTVVGTFHYGDRYNYVRPIDDKITIDVIIPRGMEIPPTEAELEAADTPPSARRRAKTKTKDVDRVIGAEARRRQWDDLENIVVDVEITEWPTQTQNPRGRVVEILGYEDDFGVDVEIVIRKHYLPHRFPTAVLEEAQSIEPVISSREMRYRRDFRALPIVTIDGETARDFDDAVLVTRTANGHYELQVHIADVAHYVLDGNPIDSEARLRGTSVYFPDRAIPMLPMELSTDICSLRPHVERLVLSCIMQIDTHGEVLGYEIMPGVIRSAERMTYTNVNAVLENDPAMRQRYGPLVGNFELMAELAKILNKKRQRRGSIDFDLPEAVIDFDENGLMKGVTRSERNLAHRLIEEFMLSANECVASYLESKGVASLYRIHDKPNPKRVYEFENTAAAFGYSLGVGALPVKRFEPRGDKRSRYGTGRRQPAPIELPEEVHITPRMYQKLTEKIAGKLEERILSYLMLRSLKQAKYSEINQGHFALAAPTYTHFTSPIRRYPDLIIHRILKEVLADDAERRDGEIPVGLGDVAHSESPSPWSKRDKLSPDLPSHGKTPRGKTSPWDESASTRGPAPKRGRKQQPHLNEREDVRQPLDDPISEPELHDIAEESSTAERRADEASRELLEWKKIKFMSDRIGEDFDGLIISITKFGMFVELNELFIEGLVPLTSLADDRYTYNETTKQIIGSRTGKRYSLGQPIHVIVDRIDRMQRRIQFAVMEEAAPPRAKKRHKRSR